MNFAALIMLLVLVGGSAEAITGNDWKTFPPLRQEAYIMGVLDGWMFVESARRRFNGHPSVVTRINKCTVEKMNYAQVIAVVKKFMEAHPEDWHSSMADLIWGAFDEICP